VSLDKCGIKSVHYFSLLTVNTADLDTGESTCKDINENFGAWNTQGQAVFLPVSPKALAMLYIVVCAYIYFVCSFPCIIPSTETILIHL